MNKRKLLMKILRILCYAAFILGVYLAYTLFFGRYDLISGAVGMISGQSAGFLMFMYLALTIILLKIRNKKKSPKAYYAIMIIGLIVTASFSLALILAPVSVSRAETEFNEAFGKNWKDNIPPKVEKHFREKRFNIPQYYLGKPNKDCKINRNIKYYENKNVKLYFDVYEPIEKNKNLPGNRSIIIKIHGGGWSLGDKGTGDMGPVNKYLASQGYIVFDIQYGLRKHINFMNIVEFDYSGGLLAESHTLGDFTVADQVHQIGIFTKKLAENYAEEYEAKLNSVYVMGGSAGGHLSGILGLGYNENYFKGTFSDNLNIKGIIPLYPAVDSELYFHKAMPELLEGTPKSNPKLFKHYNLSKIVDENDPPALIYQGASDGLARPKQSKMLEDAMDANQVKCCRLVFPLAGHASNFLYNSNFNQVWLYYLERFLYLTQ